MNIINITKHSINLDLTDELSLVITNISNCCENIMNDLGNDLSESIYHRALEVELRQNSYNYNSEVIIPIKYKGNPVGTVRPDIILDNKYILELKSVSGGLKNKEIQQLKVYLRHTEYNYGFLINFRSSDSDKVEILMISK
tara:strand:- start:83 stop:505 length:423 start_codon:yes stop_codon:yes gene_type:complete